MSHELADLDIEKVEALLKEAKKDTKNGKDPRDKRDDEKKKRDYSRSRSRSKKKVSKQDRSSSKSKRKDRKRSKEREERKKSKSPEKEKAIVLPKVEEKDPKMEELRILEEKLKEAQRIAEESKRDDLTCLLLNLPLNAKEYDIYQFLNKEKSGKVRDIRIIRDARNGRSKGIAYVEFYDQDSVLKAISLSGRQFMGNAIKFQHSQAEKNRLAAANKQIKYPKNPVEAAKPASTAMRIYVGGLTDILADLTETDLKELFSPFGEIDFVDLHKDPATGKSKGYAFIQYRNSSDAKEAISKMNGFIVRNKPLKVSTVQQNMAGLSNNYIMFPSTDSLDLDEDSGHNFLHSAQSRALLMQKLTRETPNNLNNMYMGQQPLMMNSMAMIPKPSAPEMKEDTGSTTTNCLILSNMFNSKDLKGHALADLKDEVEDECRNFGEVKKIFLDPENDGTMWVKFANVESAVNTQKNLHDRYFAGNKISVHFVAENIFKKKFGI